MRKLGLLMSGGLDSYVAWHYAIEEGWKPSDILCVYVDIGNPYAEKEKKAIEGMRSEGINTQYLRCDILKTEFGNMPDNENIWVPGRNLTLAAIIASLGVDEIWICALKGEVHDYAIDKSPRFFELATETLSYVHRNVKESVVVKTPFAHLSKRDLVEWALQNGIEGSQLTSTSSCLSGEAGNCGNCKVCLRRWGIFKQLGIEESYNQNPTESPVGSKHIAELVADLGVYKHFDIHRILEVLPAIGIQKLESILTQEQIQELWEQMQAYPLGVTK